MANSVLNVFPHPGGRLRFGVINEEYKIEPRPKNIILRNLTGIDHKIIVMATPLYYKYGSIYSKEINEWLSKNYPRKAGENIWLLKFEFNISGNDHIFKFIGDSRYKKIPHQGILTPEGTEIPCGRNREICKIIYGA